MTIDAGVPQGSYVVLARASAAPATVKVPSGADAQAAAIAATKTAMSGMGNSTSLWAIAGVSFEGRNLPPLVLSLQPGMTLSGRVEFEGGPRSSDLTNVRLSLAQASANDLAASAAPVTTDADGRFTIVGVIPGRYRLLGAVNGWRLKSSVVAGQDTLDFPLDVKPGESQDGRVSSRCAVPASVEAVYRTCESRR